MSIFIKGRDCTETIQGAADSADIAALYEFYKDDEPKSNESAAMWQQRNDNLLNAMLALHSNPDLADVDFYY